VAEKTELVVTIGADGVVRIETHGLKGQACLLETKDLEEALGKVKNREKTSEYYETRDKTRTGVKSR
jgi:Protein of unknown function (DUF2997)